MSTITQQMRHQAEPLWQASFNHPFIKELVTGKLPMTEFRYYLKQDRFYLQNFATLHGKIAEQLTDPAIKQFLYAGATGLDDSEKEVRIEFFQQLAITPAEIKQTQIAPNAYNYVSHMYHELYVGSPRRACAALLPCYWLYNDLGKQLISNGSPVKLYQEFIETYNSPEFTEATNTMIAIVDQLGKDADPDEKAAMITAFVRSSYFELHFWEMAYEEQKW
ncbi:thiaminase II [Lentilactobacillus kisonensis]|uniref:Aminopyrimidine aminohydrolase n=2 Tax=Lentilactobacillus kisonensis TaxID=481722 RepID=H1LKR9_9LACO|nr:thiaminase II [Lentilactobacillus kisonensis]EHO46182.1 TENA/THI-4 family protein [Lentilactobacillus kisonensis F0435]KRL22470.1 TENA THI-4 family protein [Lentilactobacillus kisonensis DSM 19906 = JCM 15041]